MNTLIKAFFKGLLAFLPVFLTIYVVFAVGSWLDRATAAALAAVAPGTPDVPGLGIAIGVVGLTVLGLLVTSRLTRWTYALVETPLRHLPVVKDLYSALKQLTTLLAPADDNDGGQVVVVNYPGLPVSAVGVLMRRDADVLGPAASGDDRVAVYLPMSYQIGGYTLFVPKSWVSPLDISVESAMRHALTGWIEGGGKRA